MSAKTLQKARAAGMILAAGAVIFALTAKAHDPWSTDEPASVDHAVSPTALDRMIARFAAEARSGHRPH